MGITTVPLEIAKAGETQRYVDLYEEQSEIIERKKEIEKQYNDIIKELHYRITEGTDWSTLRPSPYPARIEYDSVRFAGHTRNEAPWTHAQIIKGLSDKLIEAAGEFVQIKAQLDGITAQIDELLEQVEAAE